MYSDLTHNTTGEESAWREAQSKALGLDSSGGSLTPPPTTLVCRGRFLRHLCLGFLICNLDLLVIVVIILVVQVNAW